MLEKEFVLKLLAENIRVERARKKISQEYLAELVNITPQHLYRIENERVCPTILIVANIAKSLGVTLDTLLPLNEIK